MVKAVSYRSLRHNKPERPLAACCAQWFSGFVYYRRRTDQMQNLVLSITRLSFFKRNNRKKIIRKQFSTEYAEYCHTKSLCKHLSFMPLKL